MTRSDSTFVIRAPNHLGDLVVALPVLVGSGADVVVVRWLVPLLGMAGIPGAVIPLDRGGPFEWARSVRAIRARRYARGALLTPSFSAAWLFRWGGMDRLRGTATDGRKWLLSETVDPEHLRDRPRGEQYRLLAGIDPSSLLAPPRLVPPETRRQTWQPRLGARRPLVGLVPGSNAPARRWPVERFAELAAALSLVGAVCVVVGGRAETAVTHHVARAARGGIDLGGATDLVDLTAVLSLCDVVVGNDTGPLHLAGAVGTPTVTIWGPSDPVEARPTGSAGALVRSEPLPCRPCFKNECPRTGPGTRLPSGYEECMKLITVAQVLEATRPFLDGVAA